MKNIRLIALGIMDDDIDTIYDLKQYYADFKKDYTNFQQEFLGNFIHPQCAVQDNNGNHCPEKPSHNIEIEYGRRRVYLCERCYQNYLNGEFEYRNKININREDRLYIKNS